MKFTSLDLAILGALQKQAKLSAQDLSAATGASATQCWRRLKLLEQSGVIAGYTARLDPKSLGLGALAYVQVALSSHDQRSIDAFLNLIAQEDQVVDCASITGEYDFLLHVCATDPEGLESFIMKRLLALPLVDKTQSFFVLRQMKSRGPLPLGHLA